MQLRTGARVTPAAAIRTAAAAAEVTQNHQATTIAGSRYGPAVLRLTTVMTVRECTPT